MQKRGGPYPVPRKVCPGSAAVWRLCSQVLLALATFNKPTGLQSNGYSFALQVELVPPFPDEK